MAQKTQYEMLLIEVDPEYFCLCTKKGKKKSCIDRKIRESLKSDSKLYNLAGISVPSLKILC